MFPNLPRLLRDEPKSKLVELQLLHQGLALHLLVLQGGVCPVGYSLASPHQHQRRTMQHMQHPHSGTEPQELAALYQTVSQHLGGS
jgi:hypothetical protein